MSEEEATEVVEDAVVTEEVEEVETVKADAETEETKETEDGEVKAEEKPSESSPEKKKTDGFQKRIDELTKLRRDQERETTYWKELANTKEPEPEVVQGKTLADFEYDEGKYIEYAKAEAKALADADVDKRIQQEKQARTRADFSAREHEFSKTVDDYHVSTSVNDGSFHFSNEMVHLTEISEDGPALRYYLSKNKDVSARIANMDILTAAMELGSIKANLGKEKPKSISTTPKPVPKLVPTDSKVTVDPSNMSDSQFKKWRLKAIANR